MTKLEKLLKINSIKTEQLKTDKDRIAELEQIIAEQDEALAELASMIVEVMA